MCAVDWEALAKLVEAASSWAWPILAAAMAYYLRKQLRSLAGRVLEAPGWKFSDAASELARLGDMPPSVQPAVSGEQDVRPAPPPVEGRAAADITNDFSAAASAMVAEASAVPARQLAEDASAMAPELSLIALIIDFEKELRRYAAATGITKGHNARSLSGMALLQRLYEEQLIPGAVHHRAHVLMKTRNQLVHGQKVEPEMLPAARAAATKLTEYFSSRANALAAAGK